VDKMEGVELKDEILRRFEIVEKTAVLDLD